MAIQNRRGRQADFDPDKMLPGEWAISMDAKHIYMCFSAGAVLRIPTNDEFLSEIEDVLATVSDVRQLAETADAKAETADKKAEVADGKAEVADTKAETANVKADEALDMKSSLLASNAILQGIDDSHGSPVLDSSGGQIEGQVVFAELRDILDLKRTVVSLAQCIESLINNRKEL